MNTVTIACLPTAPENPHDTSTLAAVCGHPISEMRYRGNLVDIDFPDDWEPDEVDRGILRDCIELGH